MNTTPGWTPTLRYSPVNGMVVNWAHNNEPFALCGLPKRREERHPVVRVAEEECAKPVVEPVDTYDWYRWVPEIMAGLQDASEDMAASYARRAAIEFATKTRCLQRLVPFQLACGIDRYPIEPFEQERVKGLVSVESARGACACEGRHNGQDVGSPYVHLSSQELRLHSEPRSQENPWLLAKVWVAPTEDSCAHDVMLWDDYRAEITRGARALLLDEIYSFGAYRTTRGTANFRGDTLMVNRATAMRALFEKDMLVVKAAVSSDGDLELKKPSQLFGRGC